MADYKEDTYKREPDHMRNSPKHVMDYKIKVKRVIVISKYLKHCNIQEKQKVYCFKN